jgi:hypothetical protein
MNVIYENKKFKYINGIKTLFYFTSGMYNNTMLKL